jgi:N-acetylglucosamine-6-phosphate deacetylase
MAISDGSFAVEDGLIVEFRDGSNSASFGPTLRLLPGFIDIHNHGAVGHDVNSASPEQLLEIAAFLAKNGVTAWIPTLVPDSDENYGKIIESIDRLMLLQEGKPVAQAVGVHYEGVFASEKMCGALRPEYFKEFTGREVEELQRLKSGVHMITMAPEVAGGLEAIRELVEQDWVVSIGHTNADTATLDKALEAGARHMTHFFNAMGGLHHRNVGAVGWGLASDEVTFDIIADGVHVDPRILAMACRTKSTGKVSIISDSVAPTGLGDGTFDLWDGRVTVGNGCTRNQNGSIAGSVSTMLQGANLMRKLGFEDNEISKMTSGNPARLLGLDDSRGSIDVGKRADLIGLDVEGNIAFTMIGGELVQK